jgi:hypothetical protein
MDEGVSARDEKNANKIGSEDSLNSVEIDSSSEDIFGIVIRFKFNKISLLVYSSIDRNIR